MKILNSDINTRTHLAVPIINHDDDPHTELLKIINRHESCYGWTMIIAPNNLPKKSLLVAAGINLEKVLIVQTKDCFDVLFTAYKALKQDNCSALVVWDNLISNNELKLLETIASASATKLYRLNNKTHNHDSLISH